METNEGSIKLPCFMRKTSQQQVWRDIIAYRTENVLDEELPPIGRSYVMQLDTAFTTGGQKRRSFVDYMLGVLIYDNIPVLKYIIRVEVGDVCVRRRLSV